MIICVLQRYEYSPNFSINPIHSYFTHVQVNMLRSTSYPQFSRGVNAASDFERLTHTEKDLLPLTGPIALKYFSPEDWISLMKNHPLGKTQYAKFASVMITRIRVGLSNFEEVQRFHDLISSKNDLWALAIELIPELGVTS